MGKINWSLEKDPGEGGSYRRRLDDAFRAREKLSIESLRPEAQFAFYYLACAKVAKVMIGIADERPGPDKFYRMATITATAGRCEETFFPEL